jgi:hypothetical protein
VRSHRVRKVPTQYAETKYILFALATQLQFKLFFLMLSMSVYDRRVLWYLLRWFTVLVTDAGTLWLVFLPKYLLLRKHKDGKMGVAKHNFMRQALKAVGSMRPRVTTFAHFSRRGSDDPSMSFQMGQRGLMRSHVSTSLPASSGPRSGPTSRNNSDAPRKDSLMMGGSRRGSDDPSMSFQMGQRVHECHRRVESIAEEL